MTLRLTPELLRQAYDFLRAAAPISGWRLPPGEKVEFRVIRAHGILGQHIYSTEVGCHRIDISERGAGHLISLIETMAHEMIHLRQSIDGTASAKAVHNAAFHRIAKRLCATLGFDPKRFV